MDIIDYKKYKWTDPFENGTTNLIDLLYSLYTRLGVQNIPKSLNSEKISTLIPHSNKYVFILIDGMGYNQMKSTLSKGFLLDKTKLCMNTIFPSSTGTVLTSVATALLPQKHSINGWFSYSKKMDESFNTLPFKNRFNSEKYLETSFNEVFFCEQIFKQIPMKTDVILQKSLVGTDFSRWSTGDRDAHAYLDLANAFPILEDLIKQDEQPSFTFFYAGEYDSCCHKHGAKSEKAQNLLQSINDWVENFSKVSYGKCTTIIVADHGLTDILPQNFYVLSQQDQISKYFYAPPGGDARMTSFYVEDDCQKEFVQEFNNRFSDKAQLLSIDQVEKNNLLGKGVLSSIVKERFGNYLAIWYEGYAFKYGVAKDSSDKLDIGNHGGLSRDEMVVPLIIF